MSSKHLKRTFYPQWHKNYISSNPELEKKIRRFQKEESDKNKSYLENLRKKRLAEYSYIDEKQYYFTWNDFQNYLTNKDFDIEKCYIPNIIVRENKEREERMKREEEERNQLEYLRNYDVNDYINYFYEGEPFIVSDFEDNYNNSTDLEDNYSSDDNLY